LSPSILPTVAGEVVVATLKMVILSFICGNNNISSNNVGLITAIECFRERDQEASRAAGEGSVLHDLTIAYEDHKLGERASEKGLFSGTCILVVII
jgi:hypothetical protein